MPTNKIPINIIITTLAFCALICVSSVCFLSYSAIEIPPELNTLTAALVGALTAMLVKTSPTEVTKQPNVSNEIPMPVTVENEPKDPVPTIET